MSPRIAVALLLALAAFQLSSAIPLNGAVRDDDGDSSSSTVDPDCCNSVDTIAPDTDAPDTVAPDTPAPDTIAPDTDAPSTEGPNPPTDAPTTDLGVDTTTVAPDNNGTDYCPCKYDSIWLDVVYVIDSSSAVGKDGLVDVLDSIQSSLYFMTLGDQKFQTQVAVIVYATDIQVVYKFGDLKTTADIDNMELPYMGKSGDNISGGITAAEAILKGSDRTTKKTIVIIAGSYSDDDEANAELITKRFREEGGKVVTVDHVKNSLQPIPYLPFLSSPGYNLSVHDNSYSTLNMLQAYCDINCFCADGLKANSIGANNVREMPNGGCYSVATSAVIHRSAALTCKKEGGILPGIHDDDKQQFMMSLFPSKTKYWIGYSSASGSWAWDDGVTLPYSKWASGEPNAANGQCAYAWQFSGFKSEWRTAQCMSPTSSYVYACEVKPCSSTNFCDANL